MVLIQRLQRTKQTARNRTNKPLSESRITLAVHPRCGETIWILSSHGADEVCVELLDSDVRIMPVAWTSLYPRPTKLSINGRDVRLAPDSAVPIACWIDMRTECSLHCGGSPGATRVDDISVEDHAFGEDGFNKDRTRTPRNSATRAQGPDAGTASVVGKAGAPSRDGRGDGRSKR